MIVNQSQRAAALALGAWLLIAGESPVGAADRPADAILAQIQQVEIPQLPPQDRADRAKVQAFLAVRQKAVAEKAALIGELYKAHPDAPELVQLMPERWQAQMAMPGDGPEKTKAEVAEVLAKGKNEKLVAEAGFLKVVFAFQKAGQDATPESLMPAFDEFAKRFPKDPRGAVVLGAIAERTEDPARKEALNKRLEKDYPNTPAARSLASTRRRAESIGKPFAIEFSDAIKGGQVSSASLKGKVVIVDFWATWCPPCVAEIPNMVKLYDEYKDKGVEFVGVTLDAPRDQGGYDQLKDFVEKNKVQWPQYYEGKTPATEFATNWGIQAIPTVFAVDAEGNLASIEARGKLETLIPELLAKAKKAAARP